MKDEEIAILDRIAAKGDKNNENPSAVDICDQVDIQIPRKRTRIVEFSSESSGSSDVDEPNPQTEMGSDDEDDFYDADYIERLQNNGIEGDDWLKPLQEQHWPLADEMVSIDDTGQLSCPENLWQRLLEYQKLGLKWLAKLFGEKVGGILGDEMGLGKTIQIIAFVASLQASGRLKSPVLVVAPVTLLQQWLQEFHSWCPALRIILLHSSVQHDPSVVLRKASQSAHVLLTSYGHVTKYKKKLSKMNWRMIVLDEGHKIRNPDAAVTLCCKQLRTPHRIILSGTPIQNNLVELWSLFDFCYPGRLGTLPVFKNEFSIPINAGGYANASSLQVQTSFRCACHLRDLIKPYLLRRLKADVANELPQKQEQVLFCQLSPYQRDLYEFILESDVIQSVLAGNRNILSGIDLLRKVCNHPDLLFLKSGDGIEEWPGFPEPYGELSGKITLVLETLRLWKDRGHRVLLFCQTRQMLDIIEEIVSNKTDLVYLRMDGTTPVQDRGRLVDKFNVDANITLFLLTTKVGGLGLNLTGADRVLIYDPDWNPSTDLQARERAWRLGQTRPVTIYRLIMAGTIEEKVYHRQIFKQYLTNRVLKDPKQSRFFKSSDLYDLFTLSPPQEYNGTETGDLFGGLDVEIRRKLEPGEPSNDSHILDSLFEMTGLHSAIQHDQLVEKPRHEVLIIEKEAARIASEAADALRRSREERLGRAVEEITWTGNSHTKFKPPAIPKTAAQGALPSSSDILAAIRQRNSKQLGISEDADQSSLDKSFAGILDRLLLFFEDHGGVCESEAIATRFKDTLKPGQEAAFRHLLKTVAKFDGSKKVWQLNASLLR